MTRDNGDESTTYERMISLQSRGTDRRQFVASTAAGIALSLIPRPLRAQTVQAVRIKAVAFDAFAIFDPRPIVGLAEKLFPGRGAVLSDAWRARQFEYTWLRNSMGRYVDFWHVTQDALKYAAAQTHIKVSEEESQELMSAYLAMRPWPDVIPVLETLRQRQVRFALLSNLTPSMMKSCVKGSGLDQFFESLLSTDMVKAFKPDPRTYQMGVDAFGLKREEIAFAAFAGWDAAGAKAFDYPTYWANRLGLPAEELGGEADAASADLTRLPRFIGATA